MTRHQSNLRFTTLPPLERGGVEARIGFAFQDHVAASYLIELLEEPTLLEVWCETHDDITLIRQGQPSQEVEFVQVKSHALDQLWSVAILSRPDRKNGKVQHGQFDLTSGPSPTTAASEPCRFRLVTCLPPNSDLNVLQLPHDAPDRTAKADALKKLADDLERRTNNFRSPNGNGAHYWLCRMRWEVQQSGDSLSNDSKMKLSRLLASKGMTLFPDQLDDLYSRILAKARDAATCRLGGLSIRQEDLQGVHDEVAGFLPGSRLGRSRPRRAARLKDKLSRAGLADGDIVGLPDEPPAVLVRAYRPAIPQTERLVSPGRRGLGGASRTPGETGFRGACGRRDRVPLPSA